MNILLLPVPFFIQEYTTHGYNEIKTTPSQRVRFSCSERFQQCRSYAPCSSSLSSWIFPPQKYQSIVARKPMKHLALRSYMHRVRQHAPHCFDQNTTCGVEGPRMRMISTIYRSKIYTRELHPSKSTMAR